MATIEERKNEAIKRMEALKLDKTCINAFKKGNPWMSESRYGSLYEINDKEVKDKIKEFENKYNATVYHLIHNYTEFGELYSFLYVSNNEEEWEDDNADIRDGYAIAYVWNVNEEDFSEFGSIRVKSVFGGLVRTA